MYETVYFLLIVYRSSFDLASFLFQSFYADCLVLASSSHYVQFNPLLYTPFDVYRPIFAINSFIQSRFHYHPDVYGKTYPWHYQPPSSSWP